MSRIPLFALAAVLVAAPKPAWSQYRPDTTKTRAEKARERLRALGPIIEPDTARQDSAAEGPARLPPQIRVRGDRLPRAQGGLMAEGLSGVPRDSLMLELLRLQDYLPTEYKGGTARYDADSSRLELRGTAEVVQQGQRITADTSLIYYDKRDFACAYGSPVVSGAGVDSPVRSDSLCYDIGRKVGVARGAQTEVSQGAIWYVSGDLVTIENDVYSHDAIFTDCSLDHPHYHFAAGKMKVIRNNVLVARDVTLRFGDVPVFWLPFFMQSLSQGRRSGILMPRFGINDIARNSARYARRIEDVGFYWAISDHMGGELAMGWQSQNFTALRGSFDYRFTRQFFDGAFTLQRYWKSEGGRDLTLSSTNSWQPDERTSMNANISYTTSTQFIRERSLDPRELNRSIMSTISLNRRFDWGSVAMGASRTQFLSDNSVRQKLPGLTLNLAPITLFSGATWSATANATQERHDIDEIESEPNVQDSRNFTGGITNTFTLGKFSLGQSFSVTDRETEERMFAPDDSIDNLPALWERDANWNASLSFTQRLIGTSTISPGISMSGDLKRDSLDGAMITGPTRINLNASLNTDVFGFFPGLGPFQAIRHRLSPNISYNWSPEPTVNARQQRLFLVSQIQEQNRITIGLNQTFEAKYKPGREPRPSAAPRRPTLADSLAALPASVRAALPDSLRVIADSAYAKMVGDSLLAARDTLSGPKRRQTGEKMTLLSISTSALVYDFIRAREDGQGLQTIDIDNNVQSDLLRGFQVSLGHSLFRTVSVTPTAPDPQDPSAPPLPSETRREFAPHLSRISTGFSISSDSRIARLLGLGPRQPRPAPDTTPTPAEDQPGAGPAIDRTQAEQGLIGTGRRNLESAPTAPVGTWSASINYSLFRPRPEEVESSANNMLTGNLSFQPTVNWSLTWNTGYSFTERKFTDHALTLTRRLHDFDANFDFYKAQNGNFSFQFRVHLRANPDLKLDYEQRDIPALNRGR